MREARKFAERTSFRSDDKPRKKFFLVYEGEKTEQIYFDSLNQLRDDVGISPLIELIPLVRDYSERGWSNPQKIVGRIRENIMAHQMRSVTYETVMNGIMEYMIDQGILVKHSLAKQVMWKELLEALPEGKTISDLVPEANVESVCGQIMKNVSYKNDIEGMMTELSGVIMDKAYLYMKDYDAICFIVDRDRGSFSKEQYMKVAKLCEENAYRLYISNPCFEFWLLMHFEGIEGLDKDKVLENCEVSNKFNYVSNELRIKDNGYSKNHYNAHKLIVDGLDIAIRNEKYFCEDLYGLEHDIGSNIGLLIEKLRKND